MGIVRAEVVARMRGAFREGVSASRFIRDMREVGLSYRRTDMLADWRSVSGLERKAGALAYVRKDRYPTETVIAPVTWALSKEFMYVVRVKTQLRPDEPVLEHNVNIQSDVPLTPAMIEARVVEERAKEEKYFGEILLEALAWTAVRRVEE